MAALNDRRARKPFLILSVVSNLSILFLFKYASFVNESARALFDTVNVFYGVPAFEWLLPIGISFYTFQSMSYSIDVYRGQRIAERHFGYFSLYVSFFPQLVAGPIERARDLLPQLRHQNSFSGEDFRMGFLFLLWGFFLKLVVAERLGLYVDPVFADPAQYSGLANILAGYGFTYQLFCDFAGYSMIAIGSARMLGVRLTLNFNRPFISRSLSEFWRRWHITLSTWFRDYVFKPFLSVTRNRFQRYAVLLGVWGLFGLWHGASWNFIAFGVYVGCVLIISHGTKRYRKRIAARVFPEHSPFAQALYRILQTVIFIQVLVVAVVFFRSESIQDSFTVFSQIAMNSWFDPGLAVLPRGVDRVFLVALLLWVATVEIVQWVADNQRVKQWWLQCSAYYYWLLYYILIFSILMFGKFFETPFIYFQF